MSVWWSSLERIAPISDITATAEQIARVLTHTWTADRLVVTASSAPVMVPVLAGRADQLGHGRQGRAGSSHAG